MMLDRNRILSGLIALIYLILGFFGAGPETGIKILACLTLPLACIWFPDEMGSYTGRLPISGGGINQQSPGCLVRIVGWVLLLLPIIVWIMYKIFS
jgi:hypothetical protein